MLTNPTTDRLKAIRNKAGLTVRTMAQMLDMSLGGYSHYENPARFKDAFLPMDIARRIARIVEPRGVDPAEVLQLAGAHSSYVQEHPVVAPRNGFAEIDAMPWAGFEGEEQEFARLIAALVPQVQNPGTYRIGRDMVGFGLLANDVIVTDRRKTPLHGQLALGNARNHAGDMVTVVGRVFESTLVTTESLTIGFSLDLNSPDVAIYHPVVASFRLY